MKKSLRSTLRSTLAISALVSLPLDGAQADDDCALINGILPADCVRSNDDIVVEMPATANTEFDSGSVDMPAEGFLISIDGKPQVGDKRVEDLIRKTDIALSQADIQVKFDGLGVEPRLDLEIVETGGFKPGDRVTFQSRTNYPAYVQRGEIRIIDVKAPNGAKTIAIIPIRPNGQATLQLPKGDSLAAVHRVYDSSGRYDETKMLPLTVRIDRGFDGDVEEGSDATERRRIPVTGGAVTVYGTGVQQDAIVQTLGENVLPAPDGSFVIQRILPAGMQNVEVRVRGAGEDIFLERQIEIPQSEWFYFATADLTFGIRDGGGKDAAGGDYEKTYSKGRLAFYANGKTENGWEITGSADTREGDLRDIFREFDQKDPRHLLLRLDPENAYPVYGDDSTLVENAPTSGKFYLKAEKDGNFLMWGNYKARLDGGTYLRNERTHYGALGYYASQDTVANGEPRVEVTGYAAQPDNLPGRDVFAGTGGSVYFLSRQDLSTGSETVTIEVRDKVTGRILTRDTLTYGQDYDINYLQGIVTLTKPLTGSTGSTTVVGSTSGNNDVRLSVQYEYTPTSRDIDGYALGARAQVWVSDQLRFGATRMVEQTDIADQTAIGVDVLYEFSENTFIELEYAETEGPGFGSTFSNDGGLFVDTTSPVGGSGRAVRFNAEMDMRELGLNVDGRIGGYFEDRTAGFSTLDYQVDADEKLWGVFAEFEPSEDLSWRLYHDDFKDDTGKIVRESGAELTVVRSDRVTLDFGIEHVDKVTPGDPDDTGKRTDLAARITFTESDNLEWYVFGQGTLDRSGTLKKNDRLGIGAKLGFADNWSLEGEISDGSLGTGGSLLFSRDDEAGNSAYFGYTREPERELSNITLAGRDRGQFVAGGRRKVNSDLSVYNENTYDLFGKHVALTSTYGVDYNYSDFVDYSASVEIGRLEDPDGDFDRTALSLGVTYQDEQGLSGRGRLEWRRDRGVQSGTSKDADALLFSGTLRYEIDEERRLLFNLDSAFTQSDESSILDGDYVDVSLGYAYRPIDNDKLNVLFMYEYLYDMYGQQIDGTDREGPRQKSHVLSMDASYDLDRQWTVGGKMGVRLSESSPADGVAFAENNAWLTVLNLRYHATHKWDLLLEGRALHAEQAGFTEYGLLGAIYRHVGNNLEVGLGYNFGSFSDDLTDLTYDDAGLFLNVVAKF